MCAQQKTERRNHGAQTCQQTHPSTSPSTSAHDIDHFVRVRGAREHNLRNVDVDIPRDALVVFSGISGSGKSSLAFGTLYAEAQRRYFESVAPYARRLIDQVGVPAVDAIDGLPPAVALQQQRGTPSTRSSVGSVTTLSSLLRMLYSRAGDYPPRQPMLYAEDFSPNTPQGACPTCHGLGRVFEVTERSMVPDDTLSIRERAIASWPPAWHGQNLRDILVTMGIDVDKPWRELPKKTRDWILFTEEQPTVPVYAGFTPAETRAALRSKMEPSYQGTFMGARKYVLHTFATTQSALMKNRVARFMVGGDCPACKGKRLKPEALSVRFAGHDIGEIARMPLGAVREVLRPVAAGEAPASSGRGSTRSALREAGGAHAAAPDVRRTPNQSAEKRIAAQRIAHDLLARVTVLTELGLGYLSLDRSTPTLSPGELQRLRLATQIRSNLFGVVYVLDEPSAGLHPADGEALVVALDTLKRSGNSLFVVEHDLDLMRRADWLVDVGPDAGEKGGVRPLQRPARGAAACEGVAHRALPVRTAHGTSRTGARAGWRMAEAGRRHAQQPAGPVGGVSARGDDGGDRRLGLGQVQPGEPGAGRAGGRAPGPRAPPADAKPTTSPMRSPASRAAPAATSPAAWSASAGWCAWTRSPSAARRAPTWRPTRACSTMCASASPTPRRPARAASMPAGSRSTWRRAAARPARARAS
jgi:excinuclease ABC subunit A